MEERREVLSQFGKEGVRVGTKGKKSQRNVTGHSNGENQTTDEEKEGGGNVG